MSEPITCSDCHRVYEPSAQNGFITELCPLHAQAAQWKELAEKALSLAQIAIPMSSSYRYDLIDLRNKAHELGCK